MFTQDFDADLGAFTELLDGGPFAFSRFGDGEASILRQRRVYVSSETEQWHSVGAKWAADRLRVALAYRSDGYILGLSPSCCTKSAHDYLQRCVRAPLGQRTFATLFCHANYDAALALDLRKDSVLVGSSEVCDIKIPANAVNNSWDVESLVEDLSSIDKRILVAGGPAACWIVHHYWMKVRKQTILDIGALYDPEIHGRSTRPYHDRSSPWREHRCVW